MIILTVTPTDGYNLKECKKHDGHYSSVMVHQLENVDSHLNRDHLFNSTVTQKILTWSESGYISSYHDRLYLHDERNPQEECYTTNSKYQQFLLFKNQDHLMLKLIQQTGHQNFNHCKLEKITKKKQNIELDSY